MKKCAGELINEYTDDYSLYQHAPKKDHYCPRMGGEGRYNTTKGNCIDRRRSECKRLNCSTHELSQTQDVDRLTAHKLLKQDKKRKPKITA